MCQVCGSAVKAGVFRFEREILGSHRPQNMTHELQPQHKHFHIDNNIISCTFFCFTSFNCFFTSCSRKVKKQRRGVELLEWIYIIPYPLPLPSCPSIPQLGLYVSRQVVTRNYTIPKDGSVSDDYRYFTRISQ